MAGIRIPGNIPKIFHGITLVIILIIVLCYAFGGNFAAKAHHNACHQPEATIIASFDFGTFGVTDNGAQHAIILAPDNSASYDPDMVALTAPQRAEILLERQGVRQGPNCLTNFVLTASGTNGTITNGAGKFFTISDYTDNAPVLDANGDAMLHIGATLRTSGDGTPYNSGNYTSTVDITIDRQ